MESWDGLKYGPLGIASVSERRVQCEDAVYQLRTAEFITLLRLMACQGSAVSRFVLVRGLANEYTLRLTICRLRKFLKEHFGDLVEIERRSSFGYKLSLTGELFFIPYGDSGQSEPRFRL